MGVGGFSQVVITVSGHREKSKSWVPSGSATVTAEFPPRLVYFRISGEWARHCRGMGASVRQSERLGAMNPSGSPGKYPA